MDEGEVTVFSINAWLSIHSSGKQRIFERNCYYENSIEALAGDERGFCILLIGLVVWLNLGYGLLSEQSYPYALALISAWDFRRTKTAYNTLPKKSASATC